MASLQMQEKDPTGGALRNYLQTPLGVSIFSHVESRDQLFQHLAHISRGLNPGCEDT